jgi:hypothetical protein
MTRMLSRALIAACASLLLVPAAVLAEVRSGSVTDPTGDVPLPQHDITAAELSYDTSGSFVAKITLAAAPDASTLTDIGASAGKINGPACSGNMAAVARAPSGPMQALLFPPEQAINAPTLSMSGNTVTLTETDGRIANQPWDCGLAAANDVQVPSNLDKTDPAPLKAAAPPPSPPPATKPPATRPKPPKSSAKLRKAIRKCQRKHKSSKRSSKRARKRCISRARKMYGRRR